MPQQQPDEKIEILLEEIVALLRGIADGLKRIESQQDSICRAIGEAADAAANCETISDQTITPVIRKIESEVSALRRAGENRR